MEDAKIKKGNLENIIDDYGLGVRNVQANR